VTFTDPEIGSVGMTERPPGTPASTCAIGEHPGARHRPGLAAQGRQRGFIKLVADGRRGVLVGATAMGPNGGEVLGLLALAVHAATRWTSCAP
jgi:pyruvate/2-oxoglutarate dehydrogenase complex dihydrolipoamide dehydrogenase (E3) component